MNYIENIEVGKRLRQLRDKKRITQQEVSKIVGASDRSVIANWERGKTVPKSQYIKKYADYFGVSEDWIRYGDLMSFTVTILDKKTFNYVYDEQNLTPLQEAIYDFNKSECLLDENDYTELEEDYYLPDEDDEECAYIDFGERIACRDYIKKIDMGMLTKDLMDYILYGFANKKTSHIDSEYIYADEYEKVIKSIGYDKETILKETIKIFKTHLKDLKEIREHILKEEQLQEGFEGCNSPYDEHIKKVLLGDKPQIIQKYSNYPNITSLINKLEKIRDRDKKDISQGIYEAINKLLD